MKTTTDTLTGKPFRWNSTVFYQRGNGQSWYVPTRHGPRTAEFLHPSRVPVKLLAKLNPHNPKWIPPTYHSDHPEGFTATVTRVVEIAMTVTNPVDMAGLPVKKII